MNKFKVTMAGIIKSVIFGVGFLATEISMGKIGVSDLLALRFLVAALVFELLRRTCFKFRLNIKDILSLLPMALLMPIGYYTFEAIGIKGTSGMSAGIIISFIPVMTFMCEILFFKEKFNLKKLLFILTAVSGVSLISYMTGKGGEKDTWIGLMFLFFAALSEALYTILSGKKSKEFSVVERTYVMMWTGALIFNGINIINHFAKGTIGAYFMPFLNMETLGIILYMGIVPLVMAFLLYNYMLEREKASTVSIYAGLETVVAIIAGVVFSSDALFWYHIIGTIMIFIGVMGVNKDETHS